MKVSGISETGKRTAALLAAWVLVFAMPFADMGSIGYSLTPTLTSDAPDIDHAPDVKTVSGTIKTGDTASRLLRPYLPLSTIIKLEKKSRPVFSFNRFRKGNSYRVFLNNGQLSAFEYDIDDNDRLMIRASINGYEIKRVPIEYEIQQQVIRVDIATNLSEAVEKAGENTDLAWMLSDIFAWDIDFVRDIRPGDHFQVLVEKRFRHNAFQGYGNILAAIFANKDSVYRAFYFKDSTGKSGYYDAKGRSLQKAFLKTPVNYAKISSGFSTRRFHPILKRYRSHPGIDYAAPRNTPIKAVGDGEIIKIGRNKTMGKYITIRHFNGYETSYFHMNKYAKGMKRRRSINQGDVIGYVGKTGLATGYHLCFRMTKNGRPINPLKHPTPSAEPVSPREKARFHARMEQYAERLLAAESLAKSTPQVPPQTSPRN